jgi:hypothetical protein
MFLCPQEAPLEPRFYEGYVLSINRKLLRSWDAAILGFVGFVYVQDSIDSWRAAMAEMRHLIIE